MPVQAAEQPLRIALALHGVDGAVPERMERETGDVLGTTFATCAGRYVVRMRRRKGPQMRLTCHSVLEETPPSCRLVGIDPVP